VRILDVMQILGTPPSVFRRGVAGLAACVVVAAATAVVTDAPGFGQQSEPATPPPAAHHAVRVVAPCSGGARTIAMRTWRPAGGGSAARAHLTGLHQKRWFGGMYFGYDGEQRSGDDLTAHRGELTDLTTSTAHWGKPAVAMYTSRKRNVTCVLIASATRQRVHAGADYVGLDARPDDRTLDVYFSTSGAPGTPWDLSVRITAPDGRVTTIHRRVLLDDDGFGEAQLSRVRGMQDFSRIGIRAKRSDATGPAPIWTVVSR
jgi:hypothetical protein